MSEELFFDDFLDNKLDRNKWVEVGGLRGARSEPRYSSGRIELANSMVTLYGGGKRNDIGIRTVQQFDPYADVWYRQKKLAAKIVAYYERPNIKQDDIWFAFRVAQNDVERYVPFISVSARQTSFPINAIQLKIKKQTTYYKDFQLRVNSSLANSLFKEQLALLMKTKKSNSFNIPPKEKHLIKISLSKRKEDHYLLS